MAKKDKESEYARLWDRLMILINNGKELSKEVEQIRVRMHDILNKEKRP